MGGEGGTPVPTGGAAVAASGGAAGSAGVAGGKGGKGGAAPLEGGAGGAAPFEGGASGSSGGEPQPLEPFVAVDCFPGFTMEEEGLSFDGRFAAVLEVGAGALPTGLALLDRKSGLPFPIETASTDLDPPALSGDASRLLYGAGQGNQSRAFIWDRASEQVIADYLVGDKVGGALGFDGRFLGLITRDQALTSPPPPVQGGAVLVDLKSRSALLASITPNGTTSSDYSRFVDISDDGERVVFASPATDLAPGKTGHSWDVYLYTRSAKATTLVSRRPDGGFANGYSYGPRISGDGRFVVFQSAASDIVEHDDIDTPDVLIVELDTGITMSPTVQQPGADIPKNLSRDGRFVVFSSDGAHAPADDNATYDAWVYDRLLDKLEVASVDRTGAPLTAGGSAVAISGDGNVVAFLTTSPELVDDPSGPGILCFAARSASE